MFKSPVLRTVGLVWKPIVDKSTTKANDRVRLARVQKVEEFLRPYKLKSWRKTAYDNTHDTHKADVVTLENYETEKKQQVHIAAKRLASRQKRQARKDHALQVAQEERNARDKAALDLFSKLKTEGKILSHPSL